MRCWASLFGILALVSPTSAQIGECSFFMAQDSVSQTTPSCSEQPGRESVVWTGECKSDCFTESKRMTLTLTGDCFWGILPCSVECYWEWGTVSFVGDYGFVAQGWDAEQAPCGQCHRGDEHLEQVFCTSCGHPCWEPIIISLQDDRYQLTSSLDGVWFDLTADGEAEHIPWTHPKSDEAFLVLDRNRNGIIDDGRELFSHVSPQPPPLPGEPPHGFRALGIFDESINGGNEDGIISKEDAIFEHLRIWQDRDHDGQTDAGELRRLSAVRLASVDLHYSAKGAYLDEFGNDFHFWATATFRDHTVPAWAVFFGSPGPPAPAED